MIIPYSKIVGLPIADLQNERNIGSVREVIFNPECDVVGFMLRPVLWELQSNKIVTSDAVLSLNRDGLSIGKDEDVADVSEMVRLKGIFSHRLFGVNQKVVSRSGEQIGTVYDYFIESTTFAITKFCVRNLWRERIIPIKEIIGFETNKIIIKDNDSTIDASETVPESAVAVE